MTFNTFAEGWQHTRGKDWALSLEDRYKRENQPFPLPFDDIPQAKQEKSLLGRLEEKQPISYMRLDAVGINAKEVLAFMERSTYTQSVEWDCWKHAITYVTGKSWEEIAPIIYEGYL
jgi:hypothetical protein